MKIKFDSAMFTFEGITYASREEAKGLQRLGHSIMLGDTNYDSTFGSEFNNMYTINRHVLNTGIILLLNTKTLLDNPLWKGTGYLHHGLMESIVMESVH